MLNTISIHSFENPEHLHPTRVFKLSRTIVFRSIRNGRGRDYENDEDD